MKRKDLANTLMMISYLKKHFVSMVCTKIFQNLSPDYNDMDAIAKSSTSNPEKFIRIVQRKMYKNNLNFPIVTCRELYIEQYPDKPINLINGNKLDHAFILKYNRFVIKIINK